MSHRSPDDDSPVIVGVDGNDRGIRAARWAAGIAQKLNASLHILHARPYSGHNVSDTLAAIRAAEISALEEAATSIVAAAEHAVRVEHPDVVVTCTQSSDPVDELLIDLSRHARMIVLASDEITTIPAVLVGSTTIAVACHTACPVVAWRGDVLTPDDRPIVLGVGTDDDSRVAIGAAFELAERLSVNLIAVHGWSTRRPPGEVVLPLLIDWDAVAADELESVHATIAPWRQLYPDVDVACVVHRAKPSSAILQHSGEAQLIVVGSRGRGAFTGALLGSTSLNLLHHSPVPTMICRPEGSRNE
jgi:nucleotide-binding universal stress UspA family protein